MKIHRFYKEFENTCNEDRFAPIDTPVKSSSLFVIFKLLEGVRAQQRYFEEREEELLRLAEIGFKQIKNGNENA